MTIHAVRSIAAIGPVRVPNPDGESMPPEWKGRPANRNPRPGVYHDKAHGATTYVPDMSAGGPSSPATRSLQDPLDKLHHARRIDDAEFRAGRHMQRLLEAAEVGHIGSMDTTREPVDGGGHLPDIMSQRQLDALKELAGLWPVLGVAGEALVRGVLAHGLMPEAYASAMGMRSKRDVNAIGRLFGWHLATLARRFGFAS